MARLPPAARLQGVVADYRVGHVKLAGDVGEGDLRLCHLLDLRLCRDWGSSHATSSGLRVLGFFDNLNTTKVSRANQIVTILRFGASP